MIVSIFRLRGALNLVYTLLGSKHIFGIFQDLIRYKKHVDDESSFPGPLASITLKDQRAMSKSTWGRF